MDEKWTFAHTVECSVSKEFAWSFWTNVSNWVLDADVISVELQGPFAVGTTGVTQSKSSGRIEWRIGELLPGGVVLEFPAPGCWQDLSSLLKTSRTGHANHPAS